MMPASARRAAAHARRTAETASPSVQMTSAKLARRAPAVRLTVIRAQAHTAVTTSAKQARIVSTAPKIAEHLCPPVIVAPPIAAMACARAVRPPGIAHRIVMALDPNATMASASPRRAKTAATAPSIARFVPAMTHRARPVETGSAPRASHASTVTLIAVHARQGAILMGYVTH